MGPLTVFAFKEQKVSYAQKAGFKATLRTTLAICTVITASLKRSLLFCKVHVHDTFDT